MEEMKVQSKEWIQHCFGFGGILADRNMTRNKVAFRPTTRALALAIVLLLCMGSLVLQANQIKAYMDPGMEAVMMDYCSNRKYAVNEVTGREEEIIERPIHSEKAEQVRQRLLEYGDIEIIGAGYDNGRMKHIVPFTEELTELALQNADGNMTLVSVDAVLTEKQVPVHLTGVNENPIRLVVPEAELRWYDWYCKPADEQAYMQYATSVGDEFFPSNTDDSYAKEGFTVRVSRVDTMVRVLNVAIVMAEIITYGFVSVLLLIGLVSVISTLSTNVMMRAREFAILKSVGMTTGGLQKMLLSESILCTLKAIVWGVPFGILIPYLMNLGMRQAFPILYEIPWGLLIGSVCGIFCGLNYM